jgi:hypothetical protein
VINGEFIADEAPGGAGALTDREAMKQNLLARMGQAQFARRG